MKCGSLTRTASCTHIVKPTCFTRKIRLADPRVIFVSSLGMCLYPTDVDCLRDGPNQGMRIPYKEMQLSFVSEFLQSDVYNTE